MGKGAAKLLIVLAVGLAAADVSIFFFRAQRGNGSVDIAGIVSTGADENSIVRAATTTVRFAGYTTTTYTGAVGNGSVLGLKAGSAICNANYPGSYWGDTDDVITAGSKYPWTLSAWIQNYYAATNLDCGHWGDSTQPGGTLADTKTIYPGGTNSGWSCSARFNLACFYRP